MTDFAKDVEKFAEKSRARIIALKRAVAIELFRSVVLDTPVGNVSRWNIPESQKRWLKANGYVGGQLRGGWRPSYGAAKKDDGSPDSSGNKVLAEIQSTIKNAPPEETFILANNLPYAYRIEYDGWSSIAPEGMVRRNAKRIRSNINKKIREVKASIK